MKVEALYRHELHTAEEDDSLADAASRMDYHEIGALAVVRDGVVVGVFTERDVLRAVAAGADPMETPVGAYMTPDPVKVGPEVEVEEAARKMIVLGVRHLPVAEGDRVVGMLSARDLLGPLVWDADLVYVP